MGASMNTAMRWRHAHGIGWWCCTIQYSVSLLGFLMSTQLTVYCKLTLVLVYILLACCLYLSKKWVLSNSVCRNQHVLEYGISLFILEVVVVVVDICSMVSRSTLYRHTDRHLCMVTAAFYRSLASFYSTYKKCGNFYIRASNKSFHTFCEYFMTSNCKNCRVFYIAWTVCITCRLLYCYPGTCFGCRLFSGVSKSVVVCVTTSCTSA